MMVNPRLTTCCADSSNISLLIEDIDCKLAKLSGDLYNNIVFMLDKPISSSLFIDLLMYKRILQYKSVNLEYACAYSVEMITSRVKLLKYK
jgi:hypothetical protein